MEIGFNLLGLYTVVRTAKTYSVLVEILLGAATMQKQENGKIIAFHENRSLIGR